MYRACACVVIFATTMLLTSPSFAEMSGTKAADAWTFLKAWRVFRYDLDATLPGEHGEVLLFDDVHNEPPWLLRTSLRLARNPEVLVVLARRVSRNRDSASIPALRQALSTTPSDASQLVLERALVRLGDDDILTVLSKRLHEGSPQVRRVTASTLGGTSQKATSILVKAMETEDIQTRLAAASALAKHGNHRAKKLLGEELTSAVRYTRIEAAHALARSDDRRALPLLREQLEGNSIDRPRVIRSLGLVGGVPERQLLVTAWAKLSKGRAKAMRREVLLALGRIASRTKLTAAAAHLEDLDEEPDDLSAIRGAWLEAIGWASVRGARDQNAFLVKIRESIESAFHGETPAAHQMRRQRVSRLIAALTGKSTGPVRPGLNTGVSRATLEQWLAVRNTDEAKTRKLRFRAAVTLLAQLGESLGYAKLAEPPLAHPTGLGVERAVDGNLLTAWIAGKMAGPLRLDLPTTTRLKGLSLINGCVASQRDYSSHARVKAVDLTIDHRQPLSATFVDGDATFQHIALPNGPADQITLEITATFPGSNPDAPACIAEIRFE